MTTTTRRSSKAARLAAWLALACLTAGVAPALSGCRTAGEELAPEGTPRPSRTVYDPEPLEEPSGLARAGGYVLAVPANVLWVPWKIVGTGLKGIPDGVSAGFAKDRMPVLGLLFSPLNAVGGLLTGMAEGVAMSPALYGPDHDFGRVMGQPMRHRTTIWWY
jgi:hypothetical protein